MTRLSITAIGILFHVLAWARCEQLPKDVTEAYERAQDVVLVRITGVWLEEELPEHHIRAEFEVLENFKGVYEGKDKVTYAYEEHSLLLVPGVVYLFFLGPTHYVTYCTGSTRIPIQDGEIHPSHKPVLKNLRRLRDAA